MIGSAIRIGLRELWANRLRTALTALGIIIGAAAVVTLVTLGRGVSVQIDNELQAIGGNLLFVTPGGRLSGTAADRRPFGRGDLLAMRRRVAGIRVATALAQTRAQAVLGAHSATVPIIGTDNEYFRLHRWILSHGRLFSDSELSAGKPVCVLGAGTAAALFPGKRITGARIRVKDVGCHVIGVLAAKGKHLFGGNDDNVVLMPLKTAQRRLLGHGGIDMVEISALSGTMVTDVTKQVRQILRERRNVRDGEADNFVITDMRSFALQVQDTLGTLTWFLGAIAFVSLIVGGIGVMNTMLVAVTERTREIGIRLSIGAQENDVSAQFLVEAAILCLLGGIGGILIGYGAAWFAAQWIEVPFLPDLRLAAGAIAFTAALGFAFGYLPARRGARLNPIDALRFE